VFTASRKEWKQRKAQRTLLLSRRIAEIVVECITQPYNNVREETSRSLVDSQPHVSSLVILKLLMQVL